MIKNNRRGFTLLEAFLAAFIFIISVAAIFISMQTLRKPAVNNEAKVQAALALNKYLEDLRSQVDGRNYDTGYLAIGNHPADFPQPPVPAGYTLTYIVTADASGARWVSATIGWTDSF